MAMIPGVHTMRFESTAHLGKGETKTLAARDFDGVKAEGKATTWTIPAGQIGNQKPILVTSESWYSPDLQVTGGNNGSFGTLDNEIVFRFTSCAKDVSPQAVGGFAQRAVPSSQRSFKMSVFSRRVGVHEENKWKTASKRRAVAEL